MSKLNKPSSSSNEEVIDLCLDEESASTTNKPSSSSNEDGIDLQASYKRRKRRNRRKRKKSASKKSEEDVIEISSDDEGTALQPGLDPLTQAARKIKQQMLNDATKQRKQPFGVIDSVESGGVIGGRGNEENEDNGGTPQKRPALPFSSARSPLRTAHGTGTARGTARGTAHGTGTARGTARGTAHGTAPPPSTSHLVPASASLAAINAITAFTPRPLPSDDACDVMDITNLENIITRINGIRAVDVDIALDILKESLGTWEWNRLEPADPSLHHPFHDYARQALCIYIYEVAMNINPANANYFLEILFKCKNPASRASAGAEGYGYIDGSRDADGIATIQGAKAVYNALESVVPSGIDYRNTFGIKGSGMNRSNFCSTKCVSRTNADGTITETEHCCEWCVRFSRRGCYILLVLVEFICGTLGVPFILDVAGGKSGCKEAIKIFRLCLERLPQDIQDLVFINPTGCHLSYTNQFLGWRPTNRMTAPSQRAMVTRGAAAKCRGFEMAMTQFDIEYRAGDLLQAMYDDPNAAFINPDSEAGNAAATMCAGDQGRANYANLVEEAGDDGARAEMARRGRIGYDDLVEERGEEGASAEMARRGRMAGYGGQYDDLVEERGDDGARAEMSRRGRMSGYGGAARAQSNADLGLTLAATQDQLILHCSRCHATGHIQYKFGNRDGSGHCILVKEICNNIAEIGGEQCNTQMSLDSSNTRRRTVTRDALRHKKRRGTLETYRAEITSGRTPCVFKATETNTTTGADLPVQPELFYNFSSVTKWYGKGVAKAREPLEREFDAKGLGTTVGGNGGARNAKYWANATRARLDTAVVEIGNFIRGKHAGKTVKVRAHFDD